MLNKLIEAVINAANNNDPVGRDTALESIRDLFIEKGILVDGLSFQIDNGELYVIKQKWEKRRFVKDFYYSNITYDLKEDYNVIDIANFLPGLHTNIHAIIMGEYYTLALQKDCHSTALTLDKYGKFCGVVTVKNDAIIDRNFLLELSEICHASDVFRRHRKILGEWK